MGLSSVRGWEMGVVYRTNLGGWGEQVHLLVKLVSSELLCCVRVC